MGVSHWELGVFFVFPLLWIGIPPPLTPQPAACCKGQLLRLSFSAWLRRSFFPTPIGINFTIGLPIVANSLAENHAFNYADTAYQMKNCQFVLKPLTQEKEMCFKLGHVR